MKVDVLNIQKKKVDSIDLSDRVFNAKWNPDLVHQVIVSYMANARKPIAHTKDRGEVSGGGKKPWRQKHTGRARHGSTRSPIWVGGGVTFGPRNERDFSKKINKKMKDAALYSALSKKMKDNEIFILDSFSVESGKTKDAAALVASFFGEKPKSAFIITSSGNVKLERAVRNIPKISVGTKRFLNAYTCAANKYIVFEKSAIEELNK